MADKITIDVTVTDKEVGPGMRRVRDAIKGAFSDAERSAKNLGQSNAGVLKSFEAMKLSALGFGRARFGAQLGESGAGARKLVESLHGLSPVLDSVGLGLANMRGFAAAARLGLAGFAAVAGGAVLVGLTKAGDEAAKVRQRFDDLLTPRRPGSAAGPGIAGGKLFAGLQEDAKGFGTTVDSLAPAMESLVELSKKSDLGFRAAPGMEGFLPGVQNVEKMRAALSSLYAEMRAGGAGNEEASKGVTEFFGALKEGKLTPQMVEKVKQVAPGAANALLSATQGRTDSKGVLEGLARIGPQAKQDFKASQIKNRSLTDSLDQIKARAKSAIESEGKGPGFATKLLDQVSGNVKQPVLVDLSDVFGRIKSAGEALIASFLKGASAPKGTSEPGSLGNPPDSSSGLINRGPFASGGVVVSSGSGIVTSRAMGRIGLKGFNAINGLADGGPVTGEGSVTGEGPSGAYQDPEELKRRRALEKEQSQAQIQQIQERARAARAPNSNSRSNSRFAGVDRFIDSYLPGGGGGNEGSWLAGGAGFLEGGGRGFARGGKIWLAGGGIVRGPGTGTSDSIIATITGGRGFVRLSNGEGIVNEKAMRHLGSDGLSRINGLAGGGNVGPFVSAHPSGATSGKTVNVNLSFRGGPAHPAVMEESVAERYVQEAIAWRIASGGRRQSTIS